MEEEEVMEEVEVEVRYPQAEKDNQLRMMAAEEEVEEEGEVVLMMIRLTLINQWRLREIGLRISIRIKMLLEVVMNEEEVGMIEEDTIELEVVIEVEEVNLMTIREKVKIGEVVVDHVIK